MKPLSLRARNLRTWADLELDIPDGIAAIVGPNGAGKSTLVSVLDLALFGTGRELKRAVTRGAETVELELIFEHGGETYRVRRGYSLKGKGKPTLDLEQADRELIPLASGALSPFRSRASGTIAETEAELERILGLSRRTFRASSYLAQGDGAAFTEADPRDRKAIILDALGVDIWDRLKDAAGIHRATAERELSGILARAAQFDGELAQRAALEAVFTDHVARVAPLSKSVIDLEAGIAELRVELEDAIEAGAEAKLRRDRAEQAARAVAEASSKAEAIARLEEAAGRELERLNEESDRLTDELAILEGEKVVLDAGGARCPTCKQPLHGDALEAALAAMRGSLSSAIERQGETIGKAQEAARRYEAAGKEAEAANAYTIALMTAEGDARAALLELDGPLPDGLRERVQAKELELGRRRQALETATAARERAKANLDRLDVVAAVRAELDETLAHLKARVLLLKIAEQAYGRDGIPALILETAAIPQLESHANAILETLGRDYTVELRTLRETQAGDLKEALDVVVHTASGEAVYEDFSGGERTRLDLALRIALARLLAARRGSDVRLLAIDEPAFLDEEGFMALATVLRSLAQEFDSILVVSHVDALKDAFDSALIVGGGADTNEPSRLEEVAR